MVRSTHPAIAALTEDELLADGCCEGMESAREWSGLSLNTLYDLMEAGVLPYRRPHKANLIPRRALRIILRDYFNEPEPEPKAMPEPPRSRAALRGG